MLTSRTKGLIGKGVAAGGATIAMGLALVSAATGDIATAARTQVRHPTCSQILPASKLNGALYGGAPGGPGAGRLGGVRVSKDKKWVYPYNRAQRQAGSYCEYLWPTSQVPADYQALQGPPSGPTLGADVIVGFQLSTKGFRAARSAAQNDGVGLPSDFTAGHVRSVRLGSGTQAYIEDSYAGTGPTYNNLAIYVLTRHHNYFAVFAWDASLAQLKNVAHTVLAYKAGAF
jgi:hypothetical protein